jgi:hypothetical protein
VVVGDVDTGADFGNPDLQGKLIPGAQFLGCPGTGTGPGSDPPSGTGQAAVQDDVGHGSMTTGIAVADTNNGQGIAAVAPDAKALIVKVLSRAVLTDSSGRPYAATGQGCDNDVGAGIQWAVDHGAQVINLSIGADVPLTGSVGNITNAITYAWNHDVAVAVAAGNNQLPVSDYTTITSQAVVVGALGSDGTVASYSTNNVGVNLYAPGGDSHNGANRDMQHLVVSTSWPDPQFGMSSYAEGEGTSFAAPHAAGVLALLRSCGMGGQTAVNLVKQVASSRGKHLDAAATMAGIRNCAAPPGQAPGGGAQQSSTLAPRPGAGGGAVTGGRTAAPGAQANAVANGVTPSPSPTGAGGLPVTGAQAGQAGANPGAGVGSAGGGGRPSPLVLALLAGVVVAGAPLGIRLWAHLRRPTRAG